MEFKIKNPTEEGNNYKFNEEEEEILSELFKDSDDERPEVSLLDLYLDLFDPEFKERLKVLKNDNKAV
jgi:hypothetical protein